MTVDTERLEKAIARFDAFNNEDPNSETFEGEEHPKELLYAQRMTGWLEKLKPDASDALRLAVRCQHIGRWSIRRDEYPEGVKGYYQWRGTLAEYHAQTAGGIMGEVGYDAGAISRVQQLVRKHKLKTDPETQLLEDVACLVFLENYFAEFSKKHDDAKIIGILQKTWAKMSARGHEEALKLKDKLPPDRRRLIEEALGG